jgi:hypothetical protein
MVCTIDLIDGVKTIENFKRMQRDQWAEYRGPFRYLYIWDWQAAFSCNGEFLHFIQHAQSQRVHTKERRTHSFFAGAFSHGFDLSYCSSVPAETDDSHASELGRRAYEEIQPVRWVLSVPVRTLAMRAMLSSRLVETTDKRNRVMF